MNLRIITKNHATDPEKGFLTKPISKPFAPATALPPAWLLNKIFILASLGRRTPNKPIFVK